MAQTYTPAFEKAIDHAMLYEVGGAWDVTNEAVEEGLIDTQAHRRAVGYVNDPSDRGGETKFGVARNANPDLDITNLTWDGAKAVYYVRYWIAGHCDYLPGRVGAIHFDGCVNHGIKRAGTFLQRAVGVNPTGDIGAVTVAKVQEADQIDVCNHIADQREQFYRSIVANNPSQAKYLNGWLRRINEVRAFVTDPNNSFD